MEAARRMIGEKDALIAARALVNRGARLRFLGLVCLSLGMPTQGSSFVSKQPL
jgi:hypothetical protein